MPLNNEQLADINNKLTPLLLIIDLYEINAIKGTDMLSDDFMGETFKQGRVSIDYIINLIKDNE
jgi:hypothetical protein